MSAWAKSEVIIDPINLSDIIKSEKSEKKKIQKQIKEDFNLAKQLTKFDVRDSSEIAKEPVVAQKVDVSEKQSFQYASACSSKTADYFDSITLPNDNQSTTSTSEDDKRIAELLQAEFDLEYDEEIKRLENSRNKNSKISVSLAKYRVYPDDLLHDDSDQEDEDEIEKRRYKTWDRFEENEKELKRIGKSGYIEGEDGKIITKHDGDLSGRRNAGKVMEFLSSDFSCGDCGNFDMKISNKVFNELRKHSNLMAKKTNQQQDRVENSKTSEMGVDQQTRLILYKFISTKMILNSIDGIISKGKEAVVVHGEGNLNNAEYPRITKEVAIKIFSTTLNEFKQRDRYIKDDFRFKGSLKQNSRNIINMWCEKEFHNLNRLKKAGISCPQAIVFRKHILLMEYIGNGHENPAPKLKDVALSRADLICAYDEVVEIMKNMFQKARLVHADFSEYNILYHEGKCIVIDLAQAVEPIHPSALSFLMRDCQNITNFFEKNDVPVKTTEELFFEITKLDPLTTNTNMLEKIHMKGEAAHVVTNSRCFDDVENLHEKYRLNEFPFDYAWKKVEEMKLKGADLPAEVDGAIDDDDDNYEDDIDSWVEIKNKPKKKTKLRSEPFEIIDNESANVFKEISVTLK